MKFKIFHSSFNRSWWGNLLVFMFLAVFGLFFIFPIFYSVLNAFKPLEEILIFPPRLYIAPYFKIFTNQFRIEHQRRQASTCRT